MYHQLVSASQVAITASLITAAVAGLTVVITTWGQLRLDTRRRRQERLAKAYTTILTFASRVEWQVHSQSASRAQMMSEMNEKLPDVMGLTRGFASNAVQAAFNAWTDALREVTPAATPDRVRDFTDALAHLSYLARLELGHGPSRRLRLWDLIPGRRLRRPSQ